LSQRVQAKGFSRICRVMEKLKKDKAFETIEGQCREVVLGRTKKASQVFVWVNKFSRRNTWFILKKSSGRTDGRNYLRRICEVP
jgi:hypothetical protein